eukprot:MONOS_11276.1-p1 / transcript=MONOS_11276.1 / gene=MONOS_11276 / organism=Monocercomonoides_exilis_PA203 / gene_product=unspecified product / transcript_product=unspecified product / location=Mono_scaffold00557:40375-41419(+) / protein_length=329 / sequence_SO=supercontig / SO=protein_coding / is_pseudo=false
MIVDEDKKNEEKNEKLLADLCKCDLMLGFGFSSELLSICVPCLLKVASNKEENKEAQKEVEMALLALCRAVDYFKIDKELFLDEIKEIIEHHQKHRNLTRLAYQSIWEYFLNEFNSKRRFEEVIVNELHFAREATRELEQLIQRVDWKRKEEGKGGKIEKEEILLMGWLQALNRYFCDCRLRNEEIIGLIGSIVKVFRIAKGKNVSVSDKSIRLFQSAARNRDAAIDGLLKGGAGDLIFEEIVQSTLNDKTAYTCSSFFIEISYRLKKNEDDEMEVAKRKELKRNLFEKMEEEGYEDTITKFHEILPYYRRRYGYLLSVNVTDCFVNV